MAEPTRLICRPWAGIPDLPADRPALDNDTYDDLLWQASELLYAWSGRQFSGGGCVSTVTIDLPPGARRRGGACWTRVGEAAAATVVGLRPLRWARGRTVVALPDPPVTSVDTVTINDEAINYRVELPTGLIERDDGRAWPENGTAAITYTHGLPPPVGGQRCAVLLAVELGKAWTGGKCRLPARVESITREGITIGVTNALDALDKGRIGIFEVDSWLASVNPHNVTRRASVWSPDFAHTRRTV